MKLNQADINQISSELDSLRTFLKVGEDIAPVNLIIIARARLRDSQERVIKLKSEIAYYENSRS